MVLATALVLALAGAGVAIARPGPVAGWLGVEDPATTAAPAPSEPEPEPVLVAGGENAPVPTPDGVRAVLDPLVAAAPLGKRVHISVLDVATRQALYARGPDVPTVPASTTKLVTAVTVLAARGPAYRIVTRAVAGANPGEVVILGAGDPTLAGGAAGYYAGAGRLDQLAGQVKRALGGTAPTKVIVDGSLFEGPTLHPDWDSDVTPAGYGAPATALMIDGGRVNPKDKSKNPQRTSAPDLAAGKAFAKALGLPASAVARGAAPPSTTPPGTTAAGPADAASPSGSGAPAEVRPGAELGRVQSPPLVRLVEFMLGESDNVVAEALARQVAIAHDQPASFAGAAVAVDGVVAELGLPEAESSLADGSGLARTNRLTPSLLTDLLALAASDDRPELAGLFAGLPVAGWSGTLDERYGSAGGAAAGAGVVRAKTGTLTGVHAISGLVTTADGRLLAFALLTDAAPGGTAQSQPAMDRIVAALAGCGCN